MHEESESLISGPFQDNCLPAIGVVIMIAKGMSPFTKLMSSVFNPRLAICKFMKG